MGLVSQLPSLTSYSQQDGPGDVGAEDPGACGSHSLHHSSTTWQLGTETRLPQWHDVPYRRPPQHGLVSTPARTFRAWPFQGKDTGEVDTGTALSYHGTGSPGQLAAIDYVLCASAYNVLSTRFPFIFPNPCKNHAEETF